MAIDCRFHWKVSFTFRDLHFLTIKEFSLICVLYINILSSSQISILRNFTIKLSRQKNMSEIMKVFKFYLAFTFKNFRFQNCVITNIFLLLVHNNRNSVISMTRYHNLATLVTEFFQHSKSPMNSQLSSVFFPRIPDVEPFSYISSCHLLYIVYLLSWNSEKICHKGFSLRFSRFYSGAKKKERINH